MGDTDPDVDDDQQDLGNRGGFPQIDIVIGLQEVRNERDLAQCLADDTGGIKQLGDIQQGHELRDGDGHNKNGTPELLDLDALLVDHHGNSHAQEIVGEGGKERPDQGPQQKLSDSQAQAALFEIEQLSKILEANPAKELGAAIEDVVIVGESHQHHEDDGQHSEHHNTGQRQSQQGLVELIVHQRPQVILAALDLSAGSGNIHADTALLDLHSPCGDKAHNEDSGQKAVQQHTDGVVTVNPHIDIQNLIVDVAALHRTDGGTVLEPVDLAQPVKTAGGHGHIGNKDNLEQQEQQSAHHLSVIQVAKAKEQEGQLYCPVALGEGGENIHRLITNGAAALDKEFANGHEQTQKPCRNGTEKHFCVIPECLKFV